MNLLLLRFTDKPQIKASDGINIYMLKHGRRINAQCQNKCPEW